MTKADSIASHMELTNSKLKHCFIKLLPESSMKSLILVNIPTVINEKDLFASLSPSCPNLKRIIIADDPDNYGRTMNVAIAQFLDYQGASNALARIRNGMTVVDSKIQASWNDPTCDVLAELALETRCIYIKNLSFNTSVETLKSLLEKFGRILKIRKFADRAFIEFESVSATKRVFEAMKERRVDGMVWEIHPARQQDEERVTDSKDKTLTFSKSTLDQNDQKTLFKFLYQGTAPDFEPSTFLTAHMILEQIKLGLKNQTEIIKLQVENMKNLKRLEQGRNNLNDGFVTNPEDSSEDDDVSDGEVPSRKFMSKENIPPKRGPNEMINFAMMPSKAQTTKSNGGNQPLIKQVPPTKQAIFGNIPQMTNENKPEDKQNKQKKRQKKKKNNKNQSNLPLNPLAGNLQMSFKVK